MHSTEIGETSGESIVQSKKQGKVQNGPKKGKGSLRRRMRFILTSPVHLFRRYVLRRRPKKCLSKDTVHADYKTPVETEAVEAAKERGVPCYMVFLGLHQSGKSTTISKLFNGKRPTQSGSVVDRAVKVHRSEVVGDDIGLHVVDTPGFCENESSNGELVMALTSFLNRDLPCRIPTVTFIVARVDDDDIEKREQSQFAHMLKSLSQVENLITDQHYSNLVLLLTHSQSAKNLSEATKKYQNEFAQVFPVTNPISVIAIENFRYRNRETVSADSFQKSYHQTIFGELTELARKRQEHSLHTLMSWLTEKARRFSVSFQQDIFPIESLSKQTVHQEEIVILRPDFLPYFVMHLLEEPTKRRKSTKKSKSQASDQQQLLLTCIPPGSQITLADKSIISVDKCLVGDKVLGIHSTASVITAVRQATVEEIVTEGKTIGSIYCCAVDETKDDKVAGKLIYMNDNGLLELVDPSRANVPEKSAMETFYFLELDNPNGTFVVNGFHCFASVEKGSLNNTSI